MGACHSNSTKKYEFSNKVQLNTKQPNIKVPFNSNAKKDQNTACDYYPLTCSSASTSQCLIQYDELPKFKKFLLDPKVQLQEHSVNKTEPPLISLPSIFNTDIIKHDFLTHIETNKLNVKVFYDQNDKTQIYNYYQNEELAPFRNKSCFEITFDPSLKVTVNQQRVLRIVMILFEKTLLNLHKATVKYVNNDHDIGNSVNTDQQIDINTIILIRQHLAWNFSYRSLCLEGDGHGVMMRRNTFGKETVYENYKNFLDVINNAPKASKDITVYRSARMYTPPDGKGKLRVMEPSIGLKIPNFIPLSTSMSKAFVLDWRIGKYMSWLNNPAYDIQKDKSNAHFAEYKNSELGCCLYKITVEAGTPLLMTGDVPYMYNLLTRIAGNKYDEFEIVLPPGILTVTEITTETHMYDDIQNSCELSSNQDRIKYIELEGSTVSVKVIYCKYQPMDLRQIEKNGAKIIYNANKEFMCPVFKQSFSNSNSSKFFSPTTKTELNGGSGSSRRKYEERTMAELREVCKRRQLDIRGLRKKADIIAALRRR